jgi:signal transduction histidine kinase
LSKSENKFNIYDAYNLIGICSNELRNYNKALEYHRKALQYFEDNELENSNHLDASSLNNIGYVYQNLSEHRKAIENFKAALSKKNLKKDNPALYAMLLDNLAYSNFKLKNFSQLPSLFYKALAIRDSLNTDPSGIILNKIHLSEMYLYLKDTIKSKAIATDALQFAKKEGVASDILASLEHITSVDTKNAAKYSKEYIKINDSVQQIERNIKDKFARIAYETEEISLENDKLYEQNRNLLYFFVGTLMIGMLLFVIRTQRAKNRELLLKQAQQKANEEIYNLIITQQNKIEESRTKEKKRIAQDLHDGVLGRLFGARLNLDSLNKLSDNYSIEKRINYLAELKNIEQDIREISHDLNREKYALINNFIAILNNLIEEQRIAFPSNVNLTVDRDIRWEQLSNTLKINVFRIIQEGLQNINKYANASDIILKLTKSHEDIKLVIEDNGIGFSLTSKKKGIGLQNMTSRAEELGGILDVKSKKGKGTIITVTIPLGNKKPIL